MNIIYSNDQSDKKTLSKKKNNVEKFGVIYS